MTGSHSQSRGRPVLGTVFVLALIAAIPAPAANAQDRANVAEPPAQTAPAPTSPAPPERRPGMLEAFGRWVDDSVTGMSKSAERFWRGAATQSGAASKASTEATTNIAKGALDAAKGTADALGKLGTSRVVTGRERCTLAAIGAPDCRVAAEAMCKAKGFGAGNSVDYETSETCPPQVLLSGRKEPGDCKVEHVVTKAMCQ